MTGGMQMESHPLGQVLRVDGRIMSFTPPGDETIEQMKARLVEFEPHATEEDGEVVRLYRRIIDAREYQRG